MFRQTVEVLHMTEDELGAWKVYLRLNMGSPSKQWEELEEWDRQWHLNFFNELRNTVDLMAQEVEKSVYSKLVDQEYWT